jgi:acyl-CoA synthetase (AMP-forming)/AMP-acid ligase II
MTDLSRENIASHLQAMAEQQPDVIALVCLSPRRWRFNPLGRLRLDAEPQAGQLTFRQLNDESDWLASGLEAIGIGAGVRTVLMVNPGLEFFALTFALFKVGAVPVMIDPGMGIKNLGRCLSEAEPGAFIGNPKAHLARLVLGWGRRTVRAMVTVGPCLVWGGYTLGQIRKLGQHRSGVRVARPERSEGREESLTGQSTPFEDSGRATRGYSGRATLADQPAAILFTSGSTGIAKGVVYTHAIFDTQVELLRRTYGIEPGEIDLPTFPLFALFGPALGMTAVIPDMDFTRPALVDPRKIIEAIHHFRVTNLFGSPALIDRLGRHGAEHNIRLPSLRRVISAGAPVSARALERFSHMLSPGVQVFTPYGATEALPVCSVGSDEILKETRFKTEAGEGVCVGRPVPGITVKIIHISDGPIPVWSDDLLVPPGEVGEIVVQGPVVTREYYNRPEATALAKTADPDANQTSQVSKTSEVYDRASREENYYHRMGDLGYLDETGRVWFCGRKSQRVTTPQESLFTIPCEAVFNVHPQVRRTALVGASCNGSIRPVLCVEVEKNSQPIDLGNLKTQLLALGASRPHTKGIQEILFHPAFPVDVRHNAKIFREKLAAWAARRLA